MPFCKRTTFPKDMCRFGSGRLRDARPTQAELFGDLTDVCGFTLCSVLRQLSDLSRHSVSILEELEGELVSVCRRSGALEGRLVRLQGRVAEMTCGPPARGKARARAQRPRGKGFWSRGGTFPVWCQTLREREKQSVEDRGSPQGQQ